MYTYNGMSFNLKKSVFPLENPYLVLGLLSFLPSQPFPARLWPLHVMTDISSWSLPPSVPRRVKRGGGDGVQGKTVLRGLAGET